MVNCWASHLELQTEETLLARTEKSWIIQMAPLMVSLMTDFRFKCLEQKLS